MAEHSLPLIAQTAQFEVTPPQWLAAVMADFEAFLRDHASCEKKASGMALAVASHYPDQPKLLAAMVDLAVEELNHYREVIRLLLARNITPAADTKDPYIHQLNQQVRRGTDFFLLDRLLLGAVVERRGAERFALVAQALTEPPLRKFYEAIAASEERHWMLFYNLALDHCPVDQVAPRFAQLSEIESQVMLQLPPRPALH